MSSRKGKCPGCKTPKSSHQFGAPGKTCTGPGDPDIDFGDPDTDVEVEPSSSDEPSMSVLLAAIRNLSTQMESLQKQHNDLKKQVKSPQPTPVLAANKPVQNSTNDDSPTTAATGISSSVSEKITQAASKGEYIDVADLLSTFSTFAPTCFLRRAIATSLA